MTDSERIKLKVALISKAKFSSRSTGVTAWEWEEKIRAECPEMIEAIGGETNFQHLIKYYWHLL